jgi:hypothetical protein
VRATDETNGIGEIEPHHDFVARAGIGRCRQRHTRHAGKMLLQYVQPKIVLAEIVAPLRHAVRFVDGDQRNRQSHQPFQRAGLQQAFRCDIHEIECAGRHVVEHLLLRVPVQRRVEVRGPNADLGQRGHLVAHQRDQRRNDDAGAFAHETG